MKILSWSLKKYWLISLIVILLIPVVVFAWTAVGGGVKVSPGETGTVNLGGVTYGLKNTNSFSKDLFIPTRTQAEINSFVNGSIGTNILSSSVTNTYTIQATDCVPSTNWLYNIGMCGNNPYSWYFNSPESTPLMCRFTDTFPTNAIISNIKVYTYIGTLTGSAPQYVLNMSTPLGQPGTYVDNCNYQNYVLSANNPAYAPGGTNYIYVNPAAVSGLHIVGYNVSQGPFMTVEVTSPPGVNPSSLPTGGIITEAGGYRIHTFLNSGMFLTTAPKTVEVLVVGGGASGGFASGGSCQTGGGGGAGGVVYRSSYTLPAGGYLALIGVGGVGSNYKSLAGGNSSIYDLIAYGGGPAGESFTQVAPATGGSGGGGKGCGWCMPGSGTSGQGNNGGGGNCDGCSGVGIVMGGGGGGAGSAGSCPINSRAGNGGSGAQYCISGTCQYYGGGGGGGVSWQDWYQTILPGSGGIGGGGVGAHAVYCGTGAVAGNATPNTGGGGGGSDNRGGNGTCGDPGLGARSGDGGSGIIIIRYPL